MDQILKSITKKEEVSKEASTDMETYKRELIQQKERLERNIKKLERKEIDDKITNSLVKIQDLSNSLADLQNSLNLAWKRTKQIEEELKEALQN